MLLITRYGGTPALPDNVGWQSVPTKQQLAQLTTAFGSPLDAAPAPPASVLDAKLVAGSAEVRLSLYGTFDDKGARPLALIAHQPLAVHLPDFGAYVTWLVQYRAPTSGPSRLCVTE